MSSQACRDILREDDRFILENIKLNYSLGMSDVGKLNLNKVKGFFEVNKEIKKKSRCFQPDLVYFMPATSGLALFREYFLIRTAKKLNKKIVFHLRERIIEKDRKKLVNKLIYKRIFKNSKVIVLDESLKKDVREYFSEEDIYVLPNAIRNEIPESQFQRILQNREKNNRINLLFLSNMHKAKGWVKVLENCVILRKKKLDFVCNFVGSFTKYVDEKEFHSFVGRNKINDHVNYLGKKTGLEKNNILETTDILLFPTEYKLETFGRVVIEGMMFGIPVIANGIAAIPNTIEHEKTGFVLQHNTPEEIAGYVLQLKESKTRKVMGMAGRKRFLERYEIKNYSSRFKQVLMEL
jgi:glycosyltransferase involved in cell wall biosynthesis